MTNSEVNGTSVVTLGGRIVLGEESKSLREKLKSLMAEGKKNIVLNMDDITYIDSTGLGTLVAAHVSAKTQGTSLKLSNLGRKFQELLQLTKLMTVFEVCNTEAEAVASFSSKCNPEQLARSQVLDNDRKNPERKTKCYATRNRGAHHPISVSGDAGKSTNCYRKGRRPVSADSYRQYFDGQTR
jgi:anti-sigma B factor antagonist